MFFCKIACKKTDDQRFFASSHTVSYFKEQAATGGTFLAWVFLFAGLTDHFSLKLVLLHHEIHYVTGGYRQRIQPFSEPRGPPLIFTS